MNAKQTKERKAARRPLSAEKLATVSGGDNPGMGPYDYAPVFGLGSICDPGGGAVGNGFTRVRCA